MKNRLLTSACRYGDHYFVKPRATIRPIPLVYTKHAWFSNPLQINTCHQQPFASSENQLQLAMAGPEPELRGFARMVGGGARPLDKGWTGFELLNHGEIF